MTQFIQVDVSSVDNVVLRCWYTMIYNRQIKRKTATMLKQIVGVEGSTR